ncbi:MAG: hypothetical protein H7067_05345 [Burkholderiales bacterium]|nr:hypothetical protein [Opitutaceae bacterium]
MVPAQAQTVHAPIYFISNFERPTAQNTVYVADRTPLDNVFLDIFGTDSPSTRSNWQSSMERFSGATAVSGASIGAFRINVKDKTKGKAVIADDPVVANRPNKVLHYQFAGITEAIGSDPKLHKSRVQSEAYENINLREFYQQVRVFIPASLYDRLKDVPNNWDSNYSWFSLYEADSQNLETATSKARGSRVIFNVWRDGGPGGNLYFKLSGDVDNPENTAYINQWQFTSTAQVPRDQWFRLTFYIKEGGNSNTGTNSGEVYVEMMVDGATSKVPLFKILGPTRALNPTNKKEGYTAFSGMKTYTNKPIIDWVTLTNPTQKVPINIFWDDYRIYIGRFPDAWRITPTYRTEANVKASVTESGTVTNGGSYPTGVVPPLKWVPHLP